MSNHQPTTTLLWQAAADGGDGWRLVTDGVMGGRSRGAMELSRRDGRDCLCLSGEVSLANNGGFVQVNRDLAGARRDLSAYTGLVLEVLGNGEAYGLHLKTGDLRLPWQSYRAELTAPSQWSRVELPFALFQAHRTGAPLDLTDVRRIGVVAIGREMTAAVCIASLGLYRR